MTSSWCMRSFVLSVCAAAGSVACSADDEDPAAATTDGGPSRDSAAPSDGDVSTSSGPYSSAPSPAAEGTASPTDPGRPASSDDSEVNPGRPASSDDSEVDSSGPSSSFGPSTTPSGSEDPPVETPEPAAEPASDPGTPAPEPGAPSGQGGAGGPGSPPGPDGGASEGSPSTGLLWPIDCTPEQTCASFGFPDIDGDGLAYDCGPPGYSGHEGTDIGVTWEQMDAGVDVYAAAEGEVLFVFDGKFDRCPDDTEPDCAEPPSASADNRDGVQVCTPLGPYCGTGTGSCFWCFWGGNVVVIRHPELPGVFATRYDHLKNGSILVQPGDVVEAGEKIAEVGSAGNSTGPHLHFEVWTTGFYELGEPWAGACGPNTTESLWRADPPWL